MPLHQSVIDKWWEFNQDLEGVCFHMYLDVKGLLTTGVGNLIDTPAEALRLPWLRNSDNVYATKDEILAEWNRIKAMQDKAHVGGGNFKKWTTLHLTMGAVQDLVYFKLRANHAFMKRDLPDLDYWPADGQLGLHSMAWGLGAGFLRNGKWPNFTKAAKAGDFLGMRDECEIRGKGTTQTRNARNKLCFENADHVFIKRGDAERLYWPQSAYAFVIEPEPFEPEGEALTVSVLVQTAHQMAKTKGFHDDDGVTFGDRIALVHSEVSEAMEAFRSDALNEWEREEDGKPEGVAYELADVVIRIADMCGLYGIDLERAIREKMAFNATRPYKHGKRF
jgi:NTP pyrophosphatase (non-canonical NTP hydrolase)/GH24 family phage-related lysozyme (muramidase)